MDDIEFNFNSDDIAIYPLANRVDKASQAPTYDILSRYPVEQNIIKLPQVTLDTYFYNYSSSKYVNIVPNTENKPCINVYGHFLIYGYDINIKPNDSLYVLPQVGSNTFEGYLYLRLTTGQDIGDKYSIKGLSSKEGIQKDLDVQDNPFKPSLFKALDLELVTGTKLTPITQENIVVGQKSYTTYTYNFLIAKLSYSKLEGSTQNRWQIDTDIVNTKTTFNNMSLNIEPKSGLTSVKTLTSQDFLNNLLIDDGNIKENN